MAGPNTMTVTGGGGDDGWNEWDDGPGVGDMNMRGMMGPMLVPMGGDQLCSRSVIIFFGPYLHPIVATIARNQFIKPKLFDPSFYSSSVKERASEHEIPAALIALIATGIHAALCEWQTGMQTEIFFTKNSYSNIYHKHLASLPQRGFVVSELYDTATGTSNVDVIDDEPVVGLALANQKSVLRKKDDEN
ncbi:hypothetical protein EW146_g9462 [Bondarzewia mesenterica]|uniref:DUF6532 domain-containing protein n=1 Tax=Bondarzewia mesenterica TaxID=1095465 RepID=A0A4V6S173_9AGAM|nr:hypothetical protein EW146_g9462 [Bondarzewia mesenterica]